MIFSLIEIVNDNHEFKKSENIYKIINKNKNKKEEKRDTKEKNIKGRIQKYKFV